MTKTAAGYFKIMPRQLYFLTRSVLAVHCEKHSEKKCRDFYLNHRGKTQSVRSQIEILG